MNFEQLKEKEKAFDKELQSLHKQEKAIYEKKKKNQMAYIKGLLPFEMRMWQRVTIKLVVTEKSRELMSDWQRQLKKNQVGRVYSVTGCVYDWFVGENGDARPCFYGDVTYNRYDRIIEITLAEQIEGHCSKCRMYKDGLCYMLGGKDIGKKCAHHKVGERDFTCPKYEELTELWDRLGNHYPNVAIVKHTKPLKYRIYSLNWDYFSEYEEQEIKKYYNGNESRDNR